MWYLDVNSVKTDFFKTFFPLSHTFYFETRSSPRSKIKENAFGAHFLQLYRKNEYGDPHFLFHDFNKDSASFRREKKFAQIYVQFFGNFTKLYGLGYHVSNSACPVYFYFGA